MESEGRLQRSLDGEERVRSSDLLLSVVARLVGALWGCWMYCSLLGGSLLLHPSPLPLKDNVVFPLCLDVAVGARWWAQTQVSGDDAVV